LFDDLMSQRDVEGLLVANEIDGVSYIANIETPCWRGNLAALETLGFPLILEVARTICGEEFFCIQDFAVVKMLGDNMPIGWHQDMLHERTGHCFGMGIYLDSAGAGDGALRVVPRSHTSGRNIRELRHEPSIEVPMEAGDILIQDMMLAHASGPLTHRSLRRVLYFIFLSAPQVRRENLYPQALITRRTQVLEIAIEYYRRQHPPLPEWNTPLLDLVQDPENLRKELAELYREPIRPRPSAYYFEMPTEAKNARQPPGHRASFNTTGTTRP
ncbi:MAG: hypothetical protein JWO89_2815, partial [Verrucomicrobiaceae bacterium]|nr:hypothetical protein [Verrucomicrobiaceae bacterium]